MMVPHRVFLSDGTLILISYSHHSPFLIKILAGQQTNADIVSSFAIDLALIENHTKYPPSACVAAIELQNPN